jgi:hypothetical protein
MHKASRGIRTGSALPNPILEDAFVYEIRVTKSIQILAPGQRLHTHGARLRPPAGAGIVLPRNANSGNELSPYSGVAVQKSASFPRQVRNAHF